MQCVNLHDAATGNTAKVLVGLGFNCFGWQVQSPQGARELLWAEPGFEAGKQRPSGSGIPLLFPFPGRIGNAQFTFEDRTYLIPHDAARPHAIHGFIYDRPWRVIDQTSTKVTAAFQASVDDPSILNHWPSDFSVEASYELVDSQLRFAAKFTNTGYDPLPWGFGTHAYFRLPLAEGSSVAETVITAPVDGEWQMVDMIPTGEVAALPEQLCLSTGETLGERQFDTPYRLVASSGDVETVVADPTSGHRIVQRFNAADFPQLVIYTPGHREAVCVEPYSCVPDPFRLEQQGVATGLRTLAAGESHETRFLLTAD